VMVVMNRGEILSGKKMKGDKSVKFFQLFSPKQFTFTSNCGIINI